MSRVINQGVVVTIRVNNVGQVQNQIQGLGQRGQKAFSAWSSSLATIQKALISMVGVLAAWTIFVTIPEMLARAFTKLAAAAMQAADEIQTTTLQTAGLLASFVEFGGSTKDAFQGAILVTRQLQAQFAQLAAESVLSIQDIQLAFQTLVARGGLDFVKSIQEGVDLAATMADIVVALTGGQNKERQIVSEIAGVFEGTARAGNILSKMLQGIVGNVDQWLQKQRELGTLSFELNRIFVGIDEASKSLAETMSGRIEAIVGGMKILNEMVARLGGGFRLINELLGFWRNVFDKAVFEITSMRGGLSGLSVESRKVLDTMMNFSAAVEQIVRGLHAAILNITGTNDGLSAAKTISEVLLDIAINIRAALETISAIIGRAIHQMESAIPLWIKLGRMVDRLLIGEMAITKEVKERIDRDLRYLALMNEMDAKMAAIEQKYAKIKQLSEAQQEAMAKAVGSIEKIRNEYERVVVAESAIQSIIVARNQDIREANREFAEFPELLREAVDLLERMKKLEVAREMRDQFHQMAEDARKSVEDLLPAINLLPLQMPDIFKPGDQDIFPQDVLDRITQGLKLSENAIQNAHRWNQALDILADQGLMDIDNAMAGTNTQMEFLRRHIGSLSEALSDLQHLMSVGLVPQDMKEDTELFISELQTQIEQLRVLHDALDESVKRLIITFDPAQAAFDRFVLNLRLGVGILDNIANTFRGIVKSLPDAIAQAAAASIVAGESFLAALRKIIAKTIEAYGIETIATGMRTFAKGLFPFNPAALALGAKQMALGTAILGLAQLVGGAAARPSTGSAGGAGATTQGSERSVIFQPTANFEAIKDLKEAVARLSDAHNRLSGIAPGQVVAMGAKGARTEIAAVVRSEMNTPRMRQAVQGVVLGEAV